MSLVVISYRAHVTNGEMRSRIRLAIGPYKDLLTTSHNYEKKQIETVWAHNQINRTCKDNPTGYGVSREGERQTEKEVGRQRNGKDGFNVGQSPSKG